MIFASLAGIAVICLFIPLKLISLLPAGAVSRILTITFVSLYFEDNTLTQVYYLNENTGFRPVKVKDLVGEIEDIADTDGDGKVLNSEASVSDIYGYGLDITEALDNPAGELVDIELARVAPSKYTGE